MADAPGDIAEGLGTSFGWHFSLGRGDNLLITNWDIDNAGKFGEYKRSVVAGVSGAPVTPRLTVDVVIELGDQPGRPIVLIERRNPPPGWALPGGFVDVGETLEQAAVREAGEETGLKVQLTTLLGCYSDPRRDPRGHTASAVYVGEAQGTPVAQDDAQAVQVCAVDALPGPLAFDHARILADYLRYRATGKRPGPASV